MRKCQAFIKVKKRRLYGNLTTHAIQIIVKPTSHEGAIGHNSRLVLCEWVIHIEGMDTSLMDLFEYRKL